MLSLYTHVSAPTQCGYLPEQQWSLKYEVFAEINAAEYEARMEQGWRRFGRMLFTPTCPDCQECRPLRIPVDRHRPNRSQKRAWKANSEDVELVICEPAVTQEALELYDRYHLFQSDFKGWPFHGEKEASQYFDSFVDNPFPTQEWQYWLGEKLIGVGYVDVLPNSLSAIYFFYDPEYRSRSLGTFNVLCTINSARNLKLPHVYLGYYVAGCRSMEYKSKFHPHQLLGSDGQWENVLRDDR